VIDPSNGDILALASNPTFNPNRPIDSSPDTWSNPAISTLYEPGSTMKTLTLSAVMDARGIESQYETVTCTGSLRVGNRTIHCAKDPPTYGHHGTETMREVMENSCNIGAYEYARTIGADTLFDYERRFGILDKPNSGLPSERYCHLAGPDKKKWPQIELANIAFGQGLSLTPLQVASVYATIANNGVVVHPHILLGQGYTGAPQVAVKPEVAQTMLSFLESVVQKGTGQTAQLNGYRIGGKTGSAQVFEDGHYGNNFVGSFVGIAPLSHPRLVILCAIFKPQGMHWGAVVAAPVVRNIAAQSLRYLRVPEDNVSPALAYNESLQPTLSPLTPVSNTSPGALQTKSPG
jgi:stage V sporulation protein D (sporulation-specific penicillin-binding protein)